MRHLILPTALFLALASGCAGPGHSDAAPEAPAHPDKDSAGEDQGQEEKLHELEQKLELTRVRLEISEHQLVAARASSENRLSRLEAEIELAQRNLSKLVEADAPARIASAELDLRSTRDRAQEAAEELAQIELMYEDQDLNDKTAEFVVGRGRRMAERAAARIAIQEARFDTLKEIEIPMDEQRATLEVQAKVRGLEEARREVEITLMNKELALTEARQAVERAERELQTAREDK